MSGIKTVFPSFIYQGRLPSPRASRLNRDLTREIAALERIDDHGRDWSRTHYVNGYSSYSSFAHLHNTSPNFSALEKILAPHVRRFVKRLNWDLRGREIIMTTCWANAMGFGTHHTLHMHPLSVMSGVYYVNLPKGSSPLKLEDPRMGLFMAAPPRKTRAPTQERNYISITPAAGEFVLFESWMRHEVPPHLGEKPRLSVSFNYEWI
ncbi:MAG: TIGR02466 family protein [Bdellovibrionales bacterium]